MDTPVSGGSAMGKSADQFRDYEHARPVVEEFYRLNHAHQTLAFVLAKKPVTMNQRGWSGFFPDSLRW